jgi:CheY-like chemotaxis protein
MLHRRRADGRVTLPTNLARRRVSSPRHASAVRRLALALLACRAALSHTGKRFHVSTRLTTYVYDPGMRGRGRAPRPLVLVVDDVADTREMYEVYLRIAGYGVDTARDGREAVRFARVARPDLIVMDLQMPGMDGWAAIRQLKSDPKTANIPVIVLTGHDLKDYLKHSAVAEGAAAYLTKPLSPEQLAREITVRLTDQTTQRRRAV